MLEAIMTAHTDREHLDELRATLKSTDSIDLVFSSIQERFVDFKQLIFDDILGNLQDNPSSMDYWKAYREMATLSDCDGAGGRPFYATQMLYRALWSEDWPSKTLSSGDTMNSLYSRQKEANSLDELEHSAIKMQLDYLAYLTHTLGNFVPVPGFIQKAHAWCKEYWDSLLFNFELCCIPERVSDGFSKVAWNGLDKAAKAWIGELDQEGFVDFVNRFFLEAYCEPSSKPNWSVRPFQGHALCVATSYNLIDCLADMNACIIVRGNQMLDALRVRWNKWGGHLPDSIAECAPAEFDGTPGKFFRLYTNDESVWSDLK